MAAGGWFVSVTVSPPFWLQLPINKEKRNDDNYLSPSAKVGKHFCDQQRDKEEKILVDWRAFCLYFNNFNCGEN